MIELTGRTILLVDDEDFIREHVAKHLQRLGAEVIQACNGLEALERAAARRPDVILMDVRMPGMDGFEATRTLKGKPETADIPIIMLSAKAQDRERAIGVESGADSYLTKPARFPSILAEIQKYLTGIDAPVG